MSKHRTHQVAQKSKKNPLFCGTITREDQLKMDRAARRRDRIESGVLSPVGTGVHGGDKQQRNRRDRRQAKTATRNWQDD